MDRFFDVVGTLSWLCASLAKLLIGAVILLVVADVVARNLGLKAMTWAISASSGKYSESSGRASSSVTRPPPTPSASGRW